MATKKDNKETCKVSCAELKEKFDNAISQYTQPMRTMRVLKAVNDSKLWQALRVKFPKYQILPETNWVSYIRSNIVSSVYCVTKSAQLLPTSEEDRDAIENVNVALEYIWDAANVGRYQLEAGENAALLNIGITQVGWDNSLENKRGCAGSKGGAVFKNIDPMNFMRDPYAVDIDHASFCVTWEKLHESIIMENPRYKDSFRQFKINKELSATATEPIRAVSQRADGNEVNGYYTVYVFFVKYIDEDDVKMAEIHTINNDQILFFNNDVRPNCYPFVELYCNNPMGNIIGVSEPGKIVSNNIAYNILNSIMMTAEYKNQFPPRFISSNSQLNLASFSKYSNEADHSFIVNGDASRAVHYHQFPAPSPVAQAIQSSLAYDIKGITGVDDRYTGRDTGSILTTGGIEAAQNQVGMIDNIKLLNYEAYTKRLTELILKNFYEFSMERTYFKRDPQSGGFTEHKVKYSDLKSPALFSYAVQISNELPKNKQRIAATANILMEKQMQYNANGNGAGVSLIEPEEWLEMQDLPNKEYMFKRMHIQRLSDASMEVADDLYSYAALAGNGMNPDEAIGAVAQNKVARSRGQDIPVDIPPLPEEVPPEMMDEPMDMLSGLMSQGAEDPESPYYPPEAVELDPSMLEEEPDFPIAEDIMKTFE